MNTVLFVNATIGFSENLFLIIIIKQYNYGPIFIFQAKEHGNESSTGKDKDMVHCTYVCTYVCLIIYSLWY